MTAQETQHWFSQQFGAQLRSPISSYVHLSSEVQGGLCQVWLTMKHFAMEARGRRFDAGSRWGGHQGQSLVKMDLHRALELPGFRSVDWRIDRPEMEGLKAVSELEMECPSLLSLLSAYETGTGLLGERSNSCLAGCPANEAVERSSGY